MSTVSSEAPSADVLVPWKRRSDLVAQACAGGADAGWTLKDPVSLSYFRLRDAEYAVFTRLDGQVTYAELLEGLRRLFPAEPWSLQNLRAFLASLGQSGLVTSLVPGLSRQLAARQTALRQHRRWAWINGVLSFRWRGIDPEPLLRRIEPWTRGLFHRVTIAACMLLIGLAVLLVTLRWDTLLRRLPDATTLGGLSNLLPLAITFVLIKLLHELGHVLACRHFGGECHELGVQVLLFVPLFYGDVTDAWMVASRRARMAISAAGIFVELVLASIATLLWWFSVPGLLNSAFLNVMLVCSVNTLLFNGNPLLRYDGYYVLADLLNVPNLAQQARQALLSLWARWLTGDRDEEFEPTSPRWWMLVVYGSLSAVYRLFVTVGIVWFLHHVFGRGLGLVATAISIPLVLGAVVSPVRELLLRLRSRRPDQRWVPRRLATRATVGAALALALLFVPLPHSVTAPFVVFPGDAQPVYVTVAGRLESFVPAGTRVQSGDRVGAVINHDLLLQQERQAAEVARLELRLRNLEARRSSDESAAMRVPTTRDALASARRRYEQLTTEVRRLQLISPVAGTVLPPPNLAPLRPTNDTLSEWHGTPLEPINLGATLAEQTLFCYVGDPACHDALLLVDQTDVEFVRPGQFVRLQFFSAPGRVCEGRVAEVAATRSETVPRELTVARLIAVKVTPQGTVPANVSYEVRVRVMTAATADTASAENTAAVPLYSPGQARVACGTLSLASRLWRLLRHTFSADWSSARG